VTRRAIALAGFAARTNLRTPLTWIGFGSLVALTLVGMLSSRLDEGTWQIDPAFLFYGYALAALFVVRSGLVEQREGGLETFLRVNFLGPLEHLAAILVSAGASSLALTACTLLLASLLSAGDVATASWYAWSYGLRVVMLIPFVVMVESVSTLRIPLFPPALAWFGSIVLLSFVLGEEQAVALMSPPVEVGDFGSTVPIALRAGAGLLAGCASLVVGRCVRVGYERRARAATTITD